VLARALVLVAREELVCRELKTRVGRLGIVERGEDELAGVSTGLRTRVCLRTESLFASSDTSSLNLFRQMSASRRMATLSSLSVKLSTAMRHGRGGQPRTCFSSCHKL
jgi:hypothetical protein